MSLKEIKEILKNYYGDIEAGCYINNKWLSIKEILKILEKEGF